jgi:hypothetical protein
VVPALALLGVVVVLALRPGASDAPAGVPGRDDAAWAALLRWVDAELRPDTPVRLSDDLRTVLLAAGGDEARFQPVKADGPVALLLLTQAPPPGSVPLARFRTDDSTLLTLVDPGPGQPTAEELDRRQRLCAAVLANPNTGANGRAADVLQRAHVDARLLGLLAVLVSQLDIRIADFPAAAGEPPDGPLARRVLIDHMGAGPVGPGEPATDRLLLFLDAQRAPFAPDAVEVTEDGVLVRFRYESAPDAVVTENTP